MANYAPFGNAVFGETLFGVPPTVSASTTITIVPIGYGSLEVNWAPIKGVLSQTLVRSTYGIPTSVSDGTVLLNESGSTAYSAQFVDNGLQSGRFYYYALFVDALEQATPQIGEELLAASAQGLVLTDWGFGDTFQSWTPDWYMWADGNLATTAQPQGPLERFLNLLGYEMDWMRSEIETFTTLSSADFISGALLPALGATYGVTYEPELGMTRSRVLIKNAVTLYKQKGTPGGIAAAASAFSGYGAEVTIGKNIEIQLDDSAFDLSVGHWGKGNAATALSIVPASQYAVTPPHIAYQPIQGSPTAVALNTSLGIQGYLPDSNNENILQFTASTSALQWTQLFPATSPQARIDAFMDYNTSSHVAILFGGYSSTNFFLNDTWSWNGTTWTQLAPATSPTTRTQGGMVYFPTAGNWVLFGGELGSTGGGSNDTWTFNGTTWTQLTPAASPPTRSQFAMAALASTVLIFGGAGATSLLNDTWSWDGTTWTQHISSTSPPAVFESAMAYDVATSKVILFGGGDNSGTAQNQTWSWDGTTWTQLFPATVPPARWGHTMTYDASLGGIVMFGGDIGGGPNPMLSDTWLWNGTNWVLQSVLVAPSARQGAVACYMANASSVLLFGGGSQSTFFGDTWSWAVTGAGAFANITTCTTANAQNLGIPVSPLDLAQATPSSVKYTVSAYFTPAPTATHTLRSFQMQLDWYGSAGNLISSTVGSVATEVFGTWVRASVSAFPPGGATTFGRTVKSTTALSGDFHLMDAEQVEVATAPTSWEPPRDIKVNLIPLRQNVIPNPIGLAGTFGWTAVNGTLTERTTTPPTVINWQGAPAGVTNGFLFTGNSGGFSNFSTALMSIQNGVSYTLSMYGVRTSGGVVNDYFLSLQFYDINNNPISGSSKIVLNPFGSDSSQFMQASIINFISPANAAFAKVTSGYSGAGVTATIYFTAVLLEPSPSLLPYFDANSSDFTDYFWEGTPNESASDYYPNLEIKLSRLVEALPEYVPIGSTFSLLTGAQAIANV